MDHLAAGNTSVRSLPCSTDEIDHGAGCSVFEWADRQAAVDAAAPEEAEAKMRRANLLDELTKNFERASPC